MSTHRWHKTFILRRAFRKTCNMPLFVDNASFEHISACSDFSCVQANAQVACSPREKRQTPGRPWCKPSAWTYQQLPGAYTGDADTTGELECSSSARSTEPSLHSCKATSTQTVQRSVVEIRGTEGKFVGKASAFQSANNRETKSNSIACLHEAQFKYRGCSTRHWCLVICFVGTCSGVWLNSIGMLSFQGAMN